MLTSDFERFDKNSVIKKLIIINANSRIKTINCQSLDHVLHKCVNINDITIDGSNGLEISDQLINTISIRRIQLKHLSIDNIKANNISTQCLDKLGEHCLKNVQTFSQKNCKSIIINQTLLPFTAKLKSIECTGFDIVFHEYFYYHQNKNELFSNIESVKYLTPNNDSIMTFVDYFAHRLKSLHVIIDRSVQIDIECIKQLACFDNLEEFYCDFQYSAGRKCTEVLKQIGLKCTKLKVLGVEYFNHPFYEIFDDAFKSLESLIITECVPENIGLLRNCAQLKRLTFERTYIDDNGFNNIHLYLPQLSAIRIVRCYVIVAKNALSICSEIVMRSLAKLTNLRALTTDHLHNAQHVIAVIENCESIRRIVVCSRRLSSVDGKIIFEYINGNNRKVDVNIKTILL